MQEAQQLKFTIMDDQTKEVKAPATPAKKTNPTFVELDNRLKKLKQSHAYKSRNTGARTEAHEHADFDLKVLESLKRIFND